MRGDAVVDRDHRHPAEPSQHRLARRRLPADDAGIRRVDGHQVRGHLAAERGPDLVRRGADEVAGPPLPRHAEAPPSPPHGAELAGQVGGEQVAGLHVVVQGARVGPGPERRQGRGLPGGVSDRGIRPDPQQPTGELRVEGAEYRGPQNPADDPGRPGGLGLPGPRPQPRVAGLERVGELREGQRQFGAHARIGSGPVGEYEGDLAAQRHVTVGDPVRAGRFAGEPPAGGLGPPGPVLGPADDDRQPRRAGGGLPARRQRLEHRGAIRP